VKTITYSCIPNPSGFPNRPYLRRVDNTEPLTMEVQKICAVGIENLQVDQGTNSLSIRVTGRTDRADYTYTDPDTGDHYRRVTLSSTITPRNGL
jgi:hypothetical protein